MRALLRRRTDGSTEAGAALIVVIGLAALMMILIGTALTGALSGLNQAAADQNYTGSEDAAYAGVQDYMARINTDSTYGQYGNPASSFSSGSTVTLPTSTNPAFGTGTTGTWGTVPGSSGTATFRYEVDNSQYASNGIIRLRSTGRVGGSTRTIIANFKQQGFINYLYFTNFETQDPHITGASVSACSLHAWEGRNASTCPVIQFAASDTLAGPVRSNDTLVVCGATFNGAVTSSNPNTPLITTPAGCSAGKFNGGTPTYAPTLAIPATNTSMKTQTYSSSANPGCLYTGPTSITLNSNGTLNVVSPWTKFTNVNTSPATSGTNPAQCGTLAGLHSTAGATVTVPNKNLIFVQSVPAAGDVNYSASTQAALPTGFTCLDSTATTITGDTSVSEGWTYGSGSTQLRYPLSNEVPATNWNNPNNASLWDTTTPAYGCRDGDVFVQGTLSGQLTIASDNYVYATGNITYNKPSSDVLGLVGSNGVIVWNPMKNVNNNYAPILTDTNREIDAAILSPARTFQVQNYDVGGSRGVLTVLGSIAQNWRGTVATSNGNGGIASGYAKNYGYDARYSSITPPYYLQPTSASYAITTYASVGQAFSSTGVAQ